MRYMFWMIFSIKASAALGWSRQWVWEGVEQTMGGGARFKNRQGSWRWTSFKGETESGNGGKFKKKLIRKGHAGFKAYP